MEAGLAISLGELKALDGFVRWQDLDARLADLAAAGRLPNGYPIVPTRVPANGLIDLWLHRRWEQVHVVRIEGTPLGGDRRIVYVHEGQEKTQPYEVADAVFSRRSSRSWP